MNLVMSSFGFVAAREPAAERHRKVLITGFGRSGTSAVASMLRNAGFYLGNVEKVSTREDPVLRDLLKNGQIKEIESVLADWAMNHPLIAWKEPKLIGERGVQLISTLPDDWVVIVVFRDPLAMTMRLVSEHKGDAIETLTEVIQLQKKLLRLTDAGQKTTLLLSYEKLLAQPIEVCRDLLNFLDPALTSGVDLGLLWKKIKKDQKIYRAHAERKRQ